MPLPWRLALKAIPWATLLANAPVLARSARALLTETREGAAPNAEMQGVTARVAALEGRDREVARLLEQITTQLAALTTATEVLEARLRWLMVTAVVAIGLSLVALAAAFLVR
jgi:hypothetical protein